MKAVNYLHNCGICHRDLKLENVLFKEKDTFEPKLIDFGLSTEFGDSRPLKSILGTPLYLAPEVLKAKYDHRCDIWSLGIMMYFLLCGDAPFVGRNLKEILKKIQTEQVSFKGESWGSVSQSAQSLISSLL
jgi:calcium-dependent protein kinase